MKIQTEEIPMTRNLGRKTNTFPPRTKVGEGDEAEEEKEGREGDQTK